MPMHREVEYSQFITGEGVSSALENYGTRPEPFHDMMDDLTQAININPG